MTTLLGPLRWRAPAACLVTALALTACIDISPLDGGDPPPPAPDASETSSVDTPSEPASTSAAKDTPSEPASASTPDGPPAPSDEPAPASGECLERSGDVTKVTGVQGKRFRVDDVTDGMIIDATDAVWNGRDAAGEPMPWMVTLRGDLDADIAVCWSGGVLQGPWDDTAPGVTWEDPYHHAGGITIKAPGVLVEGVRIDNQGDGIRPYGPDAAIRGVHLSDIHDDCIENDDLYAVEVTDSLLDGCYVAFSARPVKGTSPEGRTNTWTIRDSLVRLEPQPTVYSGPRPGHGQWFKWDDEGRAPRVEVHDTVFHASQDANHGDLGLPDGFNLAGCSNNTVVWTGDGPYPAELPDCFRITSDQRVWDDAVQSWHARHPNVAGLPNDGS